MSSLTRPRYLYSEGRSSSLSRVPGLPGIVSRVPGLPFNVSRMPGLSGIVSRIREVL